MVNGDNFKLWELFGKYQEFKLSNFPEFATFDGDYRFDDKLTNYSEYEIKKRYSSYKTFLSELKKVNYENLSHENKENYDLFKYELEDDIEGEKYNSHYMPITQLGGIHLDLPQIIGFQKLDNKEDFEKYTLRLKGFNNQVEQIIENMKLGIQHKITMPDFSMAEILSQIEEVMNTNFENSPFYLPLSNSKYKDENSITKLKEIIEKDIKKAYNELYTFIKEEYIQHCRINDGVWTFENGNDLYEYKIRHYTSTNLSAEEIHQIGLEEVSRIRNEMETVKEQTGFKGSLNEFNDFLRKDSQFYYTDKNNLLNGYRKILEEIEDKIGDIFSVLPKVKCEVKELEEYRAKFAPQAYYYSSPEDRSRPAYFYANTFDLKARPKYTMNALTLHEAIPGHHLQIALAQEVGNFPWFRKNLSFTAFIEGWALYAECLGYDLGMYEDKYQHYGALTYEMERACRLVIDTGIHYKKWTRKESFDYLKENSPSADLDIHSEVNRYIVWPGQALGYKIGELKIKELKRKAKKSLGNKFDIKDFHNVLLLSGTIPLNVLEKNVSNYIEKLS